MMRELYFVSPDGSMLYVIKEGDGSNLSEEDELDGYCDYWLTWWIDIEKSEEISSGQWMERVPIKILYPETISGLNKIIDRLKACEAPEDLEEWTMVNKKTGEMLMDNYEKAPAPDSTISIQAVGIFDTIESMKKHIQQLREVLDKAFEEERENYDGSY